MAGRPTFRGNNSTKTVISWWLPLFLAFMALGAHHTAFPQTKPGRQSKAVKPNPTATPTANAPSDQKPGGEAESTKPEDKLFKGMKYRLIGPFRGGRSLTAAGIPGDLTTYYFGTTGGGVWKSTDGAMSWSPVFDKEGTGDIGSLAVANSDHNTIYVGTGEACLRGNISQGDGIYKSMDAGKTWKKVLYKDENTGGIDVAFDPRNPNILFAALWQVRRSSWNMNDGGPGSGLYRSADGGSTWKRLEEHGLPKGPYGRIGIAVAANSDRVYALIEARNPDGGLYRSDDGGETWDFINPSHSLWQRPWYYMHIIADPRDENVVYIMDVEAFKSTDGGHLFKKIKIPHGDNHGLWIDPRDTRRMIANNDGGVTVTQDGGKNWTREDNQPTAQFYHVITDTAAPYRVYGSQQDAGTVAIASRR